MALQEQHESREYEYDRRGMRGKRIFKCIWSEVADVVPTLGSPFPGKPIMRLVHVRVSPLGQPKTGILGDEYTFARLECDYATLLGPEDAPVGSLDFSADVLEVGGSRTWTTSAAAIGQPLNLFLPKLVEEVEVSWEYLNIPMLLGLIGKINSAPWRGVAAGQARFDGARSRTEWEPDLQWWKNRITLRFSFDPRGHNYAWDSDTGIWDTTSPVLYASADFTVLGF